MDCGPRPTPYARLERLHRHLTAQVLCLEACRVTLRARGPDGVERRTKTLPILVWSQLQLGPVAERRLGAGPIRWTIRVNGRLVLERLRRSDG